MKYLSVKKISDYIFIITAVFLLCFVITRYYLDNNALVLFISIVVTLALFLAYLPLSVRHDKKIKLKGAEKIEKENVINQLCINTQNTNLEFFLEFFNNSPLRRGGGNVGRDDLGAPQNGAVYEIINNFYIKANGLAVFLIFNFEKLSINQVADACKNCGAEKIEILTNAYDESVFKILDLFNKEITIKDGGEVYLLLKENNFLPKISLAVKKQSGKLKKILVSIFNQKKAKPFAVLGFCLLIYSLIFPFAFYYLIFGGVMLVYAVICKFFANPPRRSGGGKADGVVNKQ